MHLMQLNAVSCILLGCINNCQDRKSTSTVATFIWLMEPRVNK